MEEIKERVATCKVIRPIDHSLPFEVILSIDMSVITVRFILAQQNVEEQQRPAKFGSIA